MVSRKGSQVLFMVPGDGFGGDLAGPDPGDGVVHFGSSGGIDPEG